MQMFTPDIRRRMFIQILGACRRVDEQKVIDWIRSDLGVKSGLAKDCNDSELVFLMLHMLEELNQEFPTRYQRKMEAFQHKQLALV
jgi:hypothetical protein